MDSIISQISKDLKIKENYVNNTVNLLTSGSTVPFIARYRKEQTGNLKDFEIREIYDLYESIKSLNERKEDIKRLIAENKAVEIKNLDKDLVKSIDRADTMTKLEDIYRPYRSTRKTRASVAREGGLEPLASTILNKDLSKERLEEIVQEQFIDPEKEIENFEDAIQGASDIIAELISDSPVLRDMVRSRFMRIGEIKTNAVDIETDSVYEMYYDYRERIDSIADHRILAINRGEKEKILRVKITTTVDIGDMLVAQLIKKKDSFTNELYSEAILDGYNRLMLPSIEREIRNNLTDRAEEGAIEIFASNLRPLLMQSPLRNKRILAVDPAFRTGAKLAALDEIGSLLEYTTIYPVKPKEDVKGSIKIMMELIEKHDLEVVVLGNGTASRETERVIVQMLEESGRNDLSYTVISEAGASVYSASKVAREELPDIDVSIRGAVSIGRRIQDPMAELVKIDPKSIGIGQYQHDLNQKNLETALHNVVEDCVNSVGVDLNTASFSLLSYISGISKNVANNIVKYRNDNGQFGDRAQLLDVPGIGPKTYEQSAGFLRIPGGDNILDNTGVHPESYNEARQILDMDLDSIDTDSVSKELGIGELTLQDIINELKKPGRDPRDEAPPPILRSDLLTIEDLKIGEILNGTVRNVVDFGAFIDIGVGQDGLVHISNISDQYVKDISEFVEVGDIVEVKVIDVDIKNHKISLSMKN